MTDEEQVAWVDENEQVIKAISKNLANSNPRYLHSEVAVFLFDHDKKLLLQKRSMSKKVMPGIWICSAAGHITYGETPLVSAHRELTEEIGFDVSKLTEVTSFIYSLPKERHFQHWFFGRYEGGEIVLDKSEADEYSWLSKNDLDKFTKIEEVGETTLLIAKRFWSGEWKSLLK